MSDNKQSGAGKIIRTSSGSTRLTAGSSSNDAPANQARPAAPEAERPAPQAPPAPAAAPRPAQSPAPSQSEPSSSAPTGSGPSGAGRTGSGPATSVLDSADSRTVRASSGGVKMGVKGMVSNAKKKKGPRTVRLTVSAVDPWSVMKMSFLMSVAIGIATVVAFIVLWVVLQATGVMSSLQSTMTELAGAESADRIIGIFGFGRVVAAGFIIAVINIVLMTALSTLAAFLYNIGSIIAGGFHLTLTDD